MAAASIDDNIGVLGRSIKGVGDGLTLDEASLSGELEIVNPLI